METYLVVFECKELNFQHVQEIEGFDLADCAAIAMDLLEQLNAATVAQLTITSITVVSTNKEYSVDISR